MLGVSLATISSLGDAGADLSANEQIRLASLTHPRRRRQFLAGRMLSRQLLVGAYGGKAADWVITADAGSKPVIAGRADIHLSISHSADYVICAIASRPVGVDIECLAARRSTDELMQIVCNPLEQASLAELSPQDQAQQFLELWTLKEAWLKRSGAALDVRRMRALHWVAAQAADAQAASWFFQEAGIAVSLVCASVADATPDWCGMPAPPGAGWRKFI